MSLFADGPVYAARRVTRQEPHLLLQVLPGTMLYSRPLKGMDTTAFLTQESTVDRAIHTFTGHRTAWTSQLHIGHGDGGQPVKGTPGRKEDL
ncbi:hypothetical protein CB1_000287020 [Camelus ferus]|nr:hypothetical protein CB1_000287020 [Camelus ferus]